MDRFLAPLASVDATAPDLNAFAQYGVLGIIAALLIWFAKGAHQRERDRADRMEAENRRLYQLFLDQVVPALTSATRTAEETTELLRAIQREREQARQRKAKGDD